MNKGLKDLIAFIKISNGSNIHIIVLIFFSNFIDWAAVSRFEVLISNNNHTNQAQNNQQYLNERVWFLLSYNLGSIYIIATINTY